jgi:DNA-binding response OmpR family regulator
VAVGAPTEQGREAVSYAVRAQGGRVLLDSPDSPEQVPGPVDAVVVIDDASDPGVVARVAALRHRHRGARIVVLTPRDAPTDTVAGATTLGMPPSRRRLVRAIRGDEHVVIPPQQQALAPIGARVLVADDDAATRTVVAAMLAQFGAVSLTTESAAQAVRIALSGEVDVVLTDFHLPDSTGTEVVRRIRAGGRAGQLPVAILSGSSQEAERTSALAAGADAFLVKPVTGRELHAALTQLLRLDQAPAPTALEPGRLETLAEETGDPQMVVEVVGVFLAELPARLERIRAAHAGGETAGLREAAHALGSPALMIGAVALGEACRALEAGADNRDADRLVAVVEGEVPRAKAALRAYVAAATRS